MHWRPAYSLRPTLVEALHLTIGLGSTYWTVKLLGAAWIMVVLLGILTKEIAVDPGVNAGVQFLWEIPERRVYIWGLGDDQYISLREKGWMDLSMYLLGFALAVVLLWTTV